MAGCALAGGRGGGPVRLVVDPARLALAAVLAVVSTHTAMNLGGPVGVAVYAVVMACVVLLALPLLTDLLERAPSWVAPTLVVLGLAVLIVGFVHGVPPSWAYPLGAGSDRADALDVGLARLAAGLYPYTGLTYLQNPITPLPGSLVLAAPFWWLTGSSAAQNVFWTAALLPVLCGGWRLRREATVLWLLVVMGCLEAGREYLVGDDLVTSVVPAVAATVWVLHARSPRVLAAAAVALGIATCTRPHLALVVVIVAVAVGLRAGRRRALLVGGVAAATWAVLIVPFLLGGPGRFSPLHVGAKVTGERGVHPAIVVITVVALGLLAAFLRWLRPATDAAVGWCAAAVLFAPTVLSAGLWLLLTGGVWDADLTLGAGAVPFAAWAVAVRDRSPSLARGEEPVALAC
ncbi:hypothetical protein LQ327_16650 [Actinomycetospora endophytica]|uniref:DUF2029 domain-containing protein n=1 Tax=Actinomycetospora endophytica TaxID=2291215 RepID=A0ABS8PAF5_9PSEU|nr:hypothetical protein [Actinomycetospora endophytica]MCD2194998.1 hypothetical protein [Actinomycetospora endophytica]